MYYYGARYYDPELGRFIQPDTIVPSAGDPQTLNRYSYCGNNPLKYVDPSGHSWELIVGAAVGGLLTGGALAGLLMGAAVAGLQHGNILQGALAGALGGMVAFAPNSVQRIIAQVGMAVLSVAAIVIGAVLIASGIGAPAGGWLIAEGVCTIASGCLSLGSQGAGLAGDYQLSETLGYAAIGTAVAAIGCGAMYGYEMGQIAKGPNYEPEQWNDEGAIQNSTNCYAYALDKQGPYPPDYKLQPWEMSGNPIGDNFTTADVRDAAIRDGLLPVKGEQGAYRVQTYTGDISVDGRVVGHDYHWYRQDANGFWSHKPGHGPVTNLDAAGKPIIDPRISARNFLYNGGRLSVNYRTFGGELWVPKPFGKP